MFPSCCVSYWNEPHCETANQSRAQHWAALWNSQSEQCSTLLFMTLPHKVITDHLILGRNPRVVNGHVKPFLENCCPYLSHILSRCPQQGERRNTQTRRYFKIIVFNDDIRVTQGKVDTPGITSRPDEVEFKRQDLNTHSQITHTWNELTKLHETSTGNKPYTETRGRNTRHTQNRSDITLTYSNITPPSRKARPEP